MSRQDVALDQAAIGHDDPAVDGDDVLAGGAADEDVPVERDEGIAHRAVDDHGTVGDEDVVDRLTFSDLCPTGHHDDVVWLVLGLCTGDGRARRDGERREEQGQSHAGDEPHGATSSPS